MSEPRPEVADSALVYKGRVFTITVDSVRYPDGRLVKMECVRHPGSVVLLPVTAGDRVLMVRQYRYVVGKWLWELPAGTLEPGESAEAAALRECHEEVGKIAGHAEKLLSLFPSPGFLDEEMHFYRLSGLRDRRADEAAPHHDPDELLNVQEFSTNELRQMIGSGEIRDMKTVVGLSLLEAGSGRW